ncbi:MAG: D-aminoacyl-tRNA deacylase, partial [Bacillota bacterium]
NCGPGLVVLLGVGHWDTETDARFLADKIVNLRLFSDADDKMNLSVKDIGGTILAVSQFTLYGDCRKGRRPNFTAAAPPDQARSLYEQFVGYCREQAVPVETGRFQAHMLVEIHNDGPVTLLLDSKREF